MVWGKTQTEEEKQSLKQKQEQTRLEKEQARLENERAKGWGPYPGSKAEAMRWGCVDPINQDVNYYERLQHDLANSYYWSGNFCLDYMFFIAQWHPILGVLLCHPNHPWTKWERIQMLIMTFAVTMVPCAVLTLHHGAHNIHLGKDEIIAIDIDETTQLLAFKLSIFIFVTIPSIIFGVIMYQLAIAETRTCICCHKFLRSCFKGCCECFKKTCTTCVILWAICTGGIAYLIMYNWNGDWMLFEKAFLMSQLQSNAIWFPVWIFLPCQLGFLSLWCAESKAVQGGANPDNSILVPDEEAE